MLHCQLEFFPLSGSIHILHRFTREDPLMTRIIITHSLLYWYWLRYWRGLFLFNLVPIWNNVPLFHPLRGAYWSNWPTEDILLVAVDFIVHSLDAGSSLCAAFLDFQKSFDSLNHIVLLKKLFTLNNMSPGMLLWFQNYLTDWVHRVKHAGNSSEWWPMKGGIPQGSVLGLLLFLIYVNDLPSQVTSGLLLQYADDTTLICCGPSKEDVASMMNHQLELIGQWTKANNMKLNHRKSSVMWFKVSNLQGRSDYPATMVFL